jgi:predicted RecB family nuclease
MDDSLEAMHHGYPVIAQAYMTKTYDDIFWSGFVDLLVRDDYELHYENDKIAARKTDGDSTKYQVFDIKHSKEDKESYQLQIANYHEVLLELGFASEKRPGLAYQEKTRQC